MPKRQDLESILIIGSGPIIIGQACEFDYSGSQACKALKEEGYRVILVNSNPATIMTDPEMADRTYVEPLCTEVLERIIERERPSAILPTLGGQTGLNLAVELHNRGILEKHGVELIGAGFEAIQKAEDRELFKAAMSRIGLDVLRSRHVRSVEAALEFAMAVGYPIVVRPSFTLGGTGGGVARDSKELADIVSMGISLSPVHEVLVEESAMGWKEYELEVMRDGADNVVIVCSIENLDPMGVHTGDSITVAPAQTLTDVEYQAMRSAAIAVMREIGVQTGGSNIQFAVRPEDGRMVVVEMNPRVSRSSALASKATGFPIAKIAAKLAVGYTLDELVNDITRETPASFEPAIDYCVVKIPRWDFSKFPGGDSTLTTQMKSVGEVMAIGRTFKEALQKAIRSLDQGAAGLGLNAADDHDESAQGGGLVTGTAPAPCAGAPAPCLGAPGARDRRGREAALSELRSRLATSGPDRIFQVYRALRAGMDIEEIHSLTRIDRWFLWHLREVADVEAEIKARIRVGPCADAEHDGAGGTRERWEGKAGDGKAGKEGPQAGEACADACPAGAFAARVLDTLGPELIRRAKRCGFSDQQLARFTGTGELDVRRYRLEHGIRPVFKLVDTCAAEFEAHTPYYYSTYEMEDEARPSGRPKVMILGSGPNRIGQGIEFDYCCVQAAFALKEEGYEVIMVNCNPETVSTDYDISDRLYFEPLTLEDVLNIADEEHPWGVIVQFGGQTPLKLALALESAGLKILGTSPHSIDLAEDREKFSELAAELGLRQPLHGTARTCEEALAVARGLGYPVLVRPSYVLGGAAMEIVHDDASLKSYVARAMEVAPGQVILIDSFLAGATEVDVDAVCDGEAVVIGGVMEHIEYAGIHSGDSACTIPPLGLSPACVEEIKQQTRSLARALGVVGLLNVQFAVKDGAVYILEANPRASRTVPFVSKAVGVPLARVATRVMVGRTLGELGLVADPAPRHVAVKEAVFPFAKFPGTDIVLGPEMRSTGEVMGIDETFGVAFAKAELAAGTPLPKAGTVLVVATEQERASVVPVARELASLGFLLLSYGPTAEYLRNSGLAVQLVENIQGAAGSAEGAAAGAGGAARVGDACCHSKDIGTVGEAQPSSGPKANGTAPSGVAAAIECIRRGQVNLLINTPSGRGPSCEDYYVRLEALRRGVPVITTIRAAAAAVEGIKALRSQPLQARSLQEHHAAS
ncbi:MAG TPA: carbamoyl-phosphate synthase large subunit [Firmicutes bacterium]|nr:carbamoyl-phosphate synthase large subunit [Bacillota bacterium]